MKNQRKETSISFEEFWKKEREKITEDKLSDPVRRMYSESIALSKNWGKEFRIFWKFPEDFQI